MSVYKNSKLEEVKKSLDSIYNQTLTPDIFLVADGPIDDELLKFLLSEQSKGKIKYIDKRDENKGLATSLNELIKKGLKENFKKRL